MPDNQKLPEYFKKYLDGRFDHLVHQINEVDTKVTAMDIGLGKMNGDVAGVKRETIKNGIMRKQKIKELQELEDATKINTKAIRIMMFAFVIGSFVWIKESRDFFIGVLMQIVGL